MTPARLSRLEAVFTPCVARRVTCRAGKTGVREKVPATNLLAPFFADPIAKCRLLSADFYLSTLTLPSDER